MRKSRGIYIDRGYVFIRIWPNGKANPVFRQCFGPMNRANLDVAEFKLREYRNRIKLGVFRIPETLRQITVDEACAVYMERHGSLLRDAKLPARVFNRLRVL